MRQAIIPDALKEAARATGFSPAIRSGGFLFLTGATGGRPDGTIPETMPDEARAALGKVGMILAAAGATEENVVELTSYHTDISASFADVQTVMEEVFSPPLPAWPAIEVAGLRRPGARIEFRVIAREPETGTP